MLRQKPSGQEKGEGEEEEGGKHAIFGPFRLDRNRRLNRGYI